MNPKYKIDDIFYIENEYKDGFIFKIIEITNAHYKSILLSTEDHLTYLFTEGGYFVYYEIESIDNGDFITCLTESITPKIIKTCICPIFDLCNFGCKCGGK